MTALDVLHALRARDIIIIIRGDRFRVWPVSKLDDGLRAAVVSNRPGIIALLQRDPVAWSTLTPEMVAASADRWLRLGCRPNLDIWPDLDEP